MIYVGGTLRVVDILSGLICVLSGYISFVRFHFLFDTIYMP
jgi:hypothetical protein